MRRGTAGYALKLLNLRTEASGALTELRELHRGS